jgi:hypothetical protein
LMRDIEGGMEHTVDSVYPMLTDRDLSLEFARKANVQPRMAYTASSTEHDDSLGKHQMHTGGRSNGRGSGRGRGRSQTGRSRGPRAPSQPNRNTGGPNRRPGTCWDCGQVGHLRKDCPHSQKESQTGPRAQQGLSAVGQGHHNDVSIRDPATGQYYSESAFIGIATALDSVELAAKAAAAKDQLGEADWIVDSGASEHITGNRQLLINYKPSEHPRLIRFGNGQVCHAAGTGDAFLVDLQGTATRIRGVWHVPDACHNLVSVKRGVVDGFSFTINDIGCQVFRRQQQVLDAKPRLGLWILRGAVPEKIDGKASYPRYALQAVPATLWHSRFAHLGYSNMLRMVQKDMVAGLSISEAELSALKGTDCEPCKRSGLTRPPFPSSDSRSSKPLQLIHTDLCGPLPEGDMGERYFLTVLDDYSKFAVVTALQKKSDAADALKGVVARLETATGHKTVTIRSDGGGEYLSTELQSWLTDRGIQHQLTTAYTPQQNGSAERLNRTLLQKVRSVLFESALPHVLWPELLCAVAHIRNRSPVSLQDVTPHEAFLGSKPDVSHLRQLGCKVYTLIPKEKRSDKLQPVSQLGRLVGYSRDRKAYRVVLESTADVVDTRDVSFVEEVAQKKQHPTPQQLDAIFPLPDEYVGPSGPTEQGPSGPVEVGSGEPMERGQSGPKKLPPPLRQKRPKDPARTDVLRKAPVVDSEDRTAQATEPEVGTHTGHAHHDSQPATASAQEPAVHRELSNLGVISRSEVAPGRVCTRSMLQQRGGNSLPAGPYRAPLMSADAEGVTGSIEMQSASKCSQHHLVHQCMCIQVPRMVHLCVVQHIYTLTASKCSLTPRMACHKQTKATSMWMSPKHTSRP